MKGYFATLHQALDSLDDEALDNLEMVLADCRDRHYRLYMLGVGGSAADCTHAVADFRKLCHIDAYAASDNISEVTSRTNDDGWRTTYVEYLKLVGLQLCDVVMVLSVGGGSTRTSANVSRAVRYAVRQGATILGITGPDGGDTAQIADVCLKVKVDDPGLVTPVTHAVQMAVLHYLFVRLAT